MATTDKVKHMLYKGWTNTYTMLFGPSVTSTAFEERGVLTPEEFVEAGDTLVAKCSSWKWADGPDESSGAKLPPNKKYLKLEGARCEMRANQLMSDEGGIQALTEDWVIRASEGETDAVEGKKKRDSEQTEVEEAPKVKESKDGAADMTFEEDFGAADPNDTTEAVPDDGCRWYDLHILYDSFQATPRVYLQGYEKGKVLTEEQIYEDIYADFAGETVTFEEQPYTKVRMASIHPCRHAETMKRMIDQMKESGQEETGKQLAMRHDMALFLFLKFISSVIPTVEYDFSPSVKV